MPTNNWIRFLRNYGPIPTNDNMYDETIQRALARLKMQPIELPAQHLAWLVDNFRSDECQSIILTGKRTVAVGVARLMCIAYFQPITCGELSSFFGKEVSRDLIGVLRAQELIASGPRSP
jgi:hypothetical protein